MLTSITDISGFGKVHQNLQEAALPYLDSKEKQTFSNYRSVITEAIFQGIKKPRVWNMIIFGALCEKVSIDSCQCRLSCLTPKAPEVQEASTWTGLFSLLPEGQEGVCMTENLPCHLTAPWIERVIGVQKTNNYKLQCLVLAEVDSRPLRRKEIRTFLIYVWLTDFFKS